MCYKSHAVCPKCHRSVPEAPGFCVLCGHVLGMAVDGDKNGSPKVRITWVLSLHRPKVAVPA